MKMNELKELCREVEADLANAKTHLLICENEEAVARKWSAGASDNVLRLKNALTGLNMAIANLTSEENQGNMK